MHNPDGLQIKSYWDGDVGVCSFHPQRTHMANGDHLNGGIMATILDCHSVGTACAALFKAEGRALDSDPPIDVVTASIKVDYLQPTPMTAPIVLRARVREISGKKITVTCSASVDDRQTAGSEGLFIRLT
jgi:acyl-coenzyme A thioesterase PaaI-like protein